MWRQVFLLPLLVLFSVANAITRVIGKTLPAASLHGRLFDIAIGSREKTFRIRNEILKETELHLKESNREIDQSPDQLRREIEESRQRASSVISSGEFVLALFFGISGFYVSPWITFVVSLIIALSASLRITAVDSLAISSPDESRSIEWLLAAKGWNAGAIEGGRLLFNTASAVGIKEYDERAFAAYIEEIFIPSLEKDGISVSKAVRNFSHIAISITKDKNNYDTLPSEK